MGRYAGWIALLAGIAGGADIILIPEIPFSFDVVVAKIRERESLGKHFTMVVVAEGAREKEHDFVTSAPQPENREARLGGIGALVATELERRTGKESRVCVLGHLQRGGTPSPFDRALCSMFGTEAIELVANGRVRQDGRLPRHPRGSGEPGPCGGEAQDRSSRRRHAADRPRVGGLAG